MADAVNQAIDNLYNWPDRILSGGEYRYRMNLQVHDALLFEVRYDALDWFLGDEDAGRHGVLQTCMSDMVDIYRCDLDGNRVPGVAPLHMGTEHAVMFNWGEAPDRERGLQCGIPERFLPKAKK